MKRHLLASCLVAFAAPLWAQDWKGEGRLEGKVTDPKGKPIAGATVKLDCPSRGGGTTVVTDKKGKWAYLGLTSCRWNLEISAEGFRTLVAAVNLASEQSRMKPLNAALELPKGPPPELVDAVTKGDEAFAAKNWTVARENYEKAMELMPELGPQMFQKLAQCYAGEKNTPKVIEYLEKSIQADPSRTDLRFTAAQSALEANIKDKGMEFLASIDDALVESPDGYFNIAVYFLQVSDVPNAIEYFSRALAKDPKLADAYYWRAMSYLRENKLAEAKADMQKCLEAAPDGEYNAKAKDILEQLKDVTGN